VKNYKALDHLELDFPPPRMKSDPDTFVLGSKNGLGKTSVLESCALLFLAAVSGRGDFHLGELGDFMEYRAIPVDIPDLLIRAGEKEATITGIFLLEKEVRVTLSLTRSGKGLFGKAMIDGAKEDFLEALKDARIGSPDLFWRFLLSLLALNPEPVLLPSLIYFHSYRKVQEGNPEFGMMVESERYRRRARHPLGMDLPISTFKVEILRLLMAQAKLFEGLADGESSEVLGQLNVLVERYAGGRIEKLRPLPDSTLDFRIRPIRPVMKGASYSIDGLSSGQKEIISTLFLIWQHSRQNPAIVLIDEPELHLNVEWHHDFVEQLQKLAPQNQYIIATHSQEVFGSVSEDHRILLSAPGDRK